MKEYLFLILSVGILCGMVKILSPKSSVSGQLSFSIKVVMLAAVLTPFFNLIEKNGEGGEIPVIITESEHNNYNEDADTIWRIWVAETTREKLCLELSGAISENFGVKARVDIPWRQENDSIVFDTVEIVADCTDDTCGKIETWVSVHYCLKSRCIKGDVND